MEPYPIGYKRNERQRRPRPAADVDDNATTFSRGTFEMAVSMARLRCHSVITKVKLLEFKGQCYS